MNTNPSSCNEKNCSFYDAYKDRIKEFSDSQFISDDICTFKVNNLNDFIGIIDFLTNHIENAQFVFRGQLNYQKLIPPIFRKPYCDIKNRHSMYWDFIQQSEAYIKGVKEFPSFVKLIILSYYGIPTPLLNWSQNSLTALYFALDDYFKKHMFDDAFENLPCVWILSNSYVKDLEKNGAALLSMAEKLADHYMHNDSDSAPSKILAMVNSVVSYQKYVNDKIISQNAGYTLSFDGSPLEDSLKKNSVSGIPSLYKIVINNPIGIKNSLISNYKAVTTFNGIEGLAKDHLDFHLFRGLKSI